MSEHSLPVTTVTEEEWQVLMRYADAHAHEFPPGKGLSRDLPSHDLSRELFHMANRMNRLYAQSLGIAPRQWRQP